MSPRRQAPEILLEFRNGDQQKIMPDEKMRIQVCVKLPCLATVLATLARALPRLPGPCHGCPSLATGLATGARALPRTVARLGQAWQGPWQAWQGPWKARQGPWQGSATRGKDRGKARPSVARPVGPCHGCPSLATGLATGGRALPRSKTPWPRWRRVLRSHGFLEFHFQGCDVLLGGWQTVGGSQVSRSFSGLGTSDSL